MVVAGLIVWGASHFVGVGFILDIAAVVVMGLAVLKAFQVMWDIYKISSGTAQKSDLERAAKMMADMVIDLGVETFLAIVLKGAAKSRFRAPPNKAAGRADELVEMAPSRRRSAAKKSSEEAPKKKKTDDDKGKVSELPKNGTLSNKEAREWYLKEKDKIPDQIDRSGTLEEQAKQVSKLRNKIRTKARALMKDRELAKSLDVTDPHMSWDDLIRKYSAEGKPMDDVYKDILGSALRSRKSVNDALGL